MLLPIYFISAITLFTASYLVLRVLFRYDYSHKGRLSPISAFAGSLIFFLWGGFPYIYGPKDWPAVHVHVLLRFLGWLLLAAGLAIMFTGISSLGFWQALGQPAPRLNQNGLYRFCRNPQIVGCFLFALGFGLLWPSWYALGWVLLFAAIGHLMVLTEEQHLRSAFPDEYLDYCTRVPRYFPFSKRQMTGDEQ